MIISHNLASLNVINKLKINGTAKSKSLENLSTALRINKAADDAAGLAISEKMRGQIRGLNMAVRNVQDGISLLQTADGAMNEIQSLLQRGRELSVQACNGTLTREDLEKINVEITQINKEVDNIANNTEFNTKKILNCMSGDEDVVNNVLNGLKKGWLEASAKRIEDVYGLAIKSDLGIILEKGTLGGVAADANGTRIRIELADFAPGDGPDGNNPYSGYNDQVIAHELTHSIMFQNMDMSTLPWWFVEGTAEAIKGADSRLFSDLQTNSESDLVNLIDDSFSVESKYYSTAYLAVRYMDAAIRVNSGKRIKDIMDHLKADITNTLDSALVETGAFTGINDFVDSFKANGVSYLKGTLAGYSSYDIDLSNSDTGAIGGLDAGDSLIEFNSQDVIDESAATDTTDGQPLSDYGINVIWPENTDAEPLILQIGANCGQIVSVELPMLTTSNLGLTNINIKGTPSESISIYDTAIDSVSSSRGKLGAMQNRLEHTLNNLSNAAENLTAAESRIRDADMGKEMMSFTKSNILDQATIAMLAQANQFPQAVLQLLK